jgi:hypothetical protein
MAEVSFVLTALLSARAFMAGNDAATHPPMAFLMRLLLVSILNRHFTLDVARARCRAIFRYYNPLRLHLNLHRVRRRLLARSAILRADRVADHQPAAAELNLISTGLLDVILPDEVERSKQHNARDYTTACEFGPRQFISDCMENTKNVKTGANVLNSPAVGTEGELGFANGCTRGKHAALAVYRQSWRSDHPRVA